MITKHPEYQNLKLITQKSNGKRKFWYGIEERIVRKKGMFDGSFVVLSSCSWFKWNYVELCGIKILSHSP